MVSVALMSDVKPRSVMVRLAGRLALMVRLRPSTVVKSKPLLPLMLACTPVVLVLLLTAAITFCKRWDAVSVLAMEIEIPVLFKFNKTVPVAPTNPDVSLAAGPLS